jgi:hypothetical protein
MEQTRIPLQAYKYHPSSRGDMGVARRKWKKTTILEAETGDLINEVVMMRVI